jgi:NAD(P)H-dependent flavin oxidoreductase YrpB (nitropropane dioxygenase family)
MKKVFRTKLCDLLGIEYHVILAGIGALPGMVTTTEHFNVSGARLVAAVSNAGGLGVLGGAQLTPEQLRSEIREVKRLTKGPFGVDLMLPETVGSQESISSMKANMMAEHKDLAAAVDRLREEFDIPKVKAPANSPVWNVWQPEFVMSQADVVFEEGVEVLATGIGIPEWVVSRAHAVGMKVIALVGNVRQARRAADRGVDIIVAQGYDAGGHTGVIGTLALLPQVVDAVYPLPVVGAGGIGDGRGLAAVLMLGAIGAWVGTAFEATEEANIVSDSKQQLLEAGAEDTMVSRMYTGKTARWIKNPVATAWQERQIPTLPMPLQTMLVADLLYGLETAKKFELTPLPAGQGAGMIKQIRSAEQVLDEMIDQAIRALRLKTPAELIIEE